MLLLLYKGTKRGVSLTKLKGYLSLKKKQSGKTADPSSTKSRPSDSHSGIHSSKCSRSNAANAANAATASKHQTKLHPIDISKELTGKSFSNEPNGRGNDAKDGAEEKFLFKESSGPYGLNKMASMGKEQFKGKKKSM